MGVIQLPTAIAPFLLTSIAPCCFVARNVWKYYFPYVPGPGYCLTAFMMGQSETPGRVFYYAILIVSWPSFRYSWRAKTGGTGCCQPLV